jgi:hypothetical protein
MIISASRRTDIPAFYSDWLLNRIKEGYCLVKHPINKNLVRRIDLHQNIVDAFVFWTKNPEPMISKLRFLDDMGYDYIFLYTLNNYPNYLEPNIPILSSRIDSFKRLSSILGPGKVIWRYDPILITTSITPQYHYEAFYHLANELQGYTNRVIISFIDLYDFVFSRLKYTIPKNESFFDFSTNEEIMYAISNNLSSIAKRYGMNIFSCAETHNFTQSGVLPGACIDGVYLTTLFGKSFSKKKDKYQRVECNCVLSTDIGQYDTCRHKCAYCYANKNYKMLNENIGSHNDKSPSLTGWAEVSENIQRNLSI